VEDAAIMKYMELFMQILVIVGTLVGIWLSLKKMLGDFFTPLENRFRALETRFDEYDRKKRVRIEQNKVLFRAFKLVLMKLDGEHINGEIEEVKKMLDDCLIDNLR